MINELDTVVLTHDIIKYRLSAGDIEVIVHYHKGKKHYEVEPVTADGKNDSGSYPDSQRHQTNERQRNIARKRSG